MMFPTAARRVTMPNSYQLNVKPSNSSSSGQSSLTFENVVCSQLELKRRAESFSYHRNTICRQPATYTTSASTQRIGTSIPMLSTSQISNVSTQFSKSNSSSNDLNRNRISSTNSIITTGCDDFGERQSLIPMHYWNRATRGDRIKKKKSLISQWSADFQKETPQYGSLRSRLIEEYTDTDSLAKFVKKTILVLLKTKAATIILVLLLILPIIMTCTGVSHLNDCPRQVHLPIYLFVSGIVWTTKLLQNIWYKYRLEQKFRNDEDHSSDHNDGHAFIDGLMTSFLIIWFILGHYWLATIGYPPHFEQPLEAPDIWCHKTVVLCALASILLTYFVLIAFISTVLFLICFTHYTVRKRTGTNQ